MFGGVSKGFGVYKKPFGSMDNLLGVGGGDWVLQIPFEANMKTIAGSRGLYLWYGFTGHVCGADWVLEITLRRGGSAVGFCVFQLGFLEALVPK